MKIILIQTDVETETTRNLKNGNSKKTIRTRSYEVKGNIFNQGRNTTRKPVFVGDQPIGWAMLSRSADVITCLTPLASTLAMVLAVIVSTFK
ncbi:hypothetical protein [Photobacterium satsumensis]|uniref:hypothetical protein n=1 Tax=Photobacterium satsumensis TaxID=2910239 RepID=UPI003D0BAEC8